MEVEINAKKGNKYPIVGDRVYILFYLKWAFELLNSLELLEISRLFILVPV